MASQNLNPIQRILDVGYRIPLNLFKNVVRPVHYGLADLLLKQAEVTKHEPEQQHLLREAIDTIELVKVAELQNYFDECVLALHSKTTNILDLDHLTNTAILYPIPLDDRVVVLVKIMDKNKIHYKIVQKVTTRDFNNTVLEFRWNLQKRSHNRFLFQAQQLYDWLIRPIEALLKTHQIDTLVVVPEGHLRMIPFSTLHDGQQFLIEKYALAITPGLTLVDPKPVDDWHNSKILLAGLSEAVQEHSILPNVPKELEKIQCMTRGYADKQLIALNKKFSSENCRQEKKTQYNIESQLLFNHNFSSPAAFEKQVQENKYSIIHLATHGEFKPNPENSYLLTYQQKMRMDQLEQAIGLGRFRYQKPLELLVLSACKTAVGNDKAALGLAGIAVKAGARSAIATLWYIDDEATSKTIREFYRQLLQQTPKLSKAKALQNVQKQLIAQKQFWHPIYWGPFLLIGNWL